MKSATLALFSVLGSATAQGVTDKIAPKGAAPAGCQPSFNGKFELSILDVTTAKRDAQLMKRGATCNQDGILVASLADGTITDSKARTGYIAANYQFQFDAPAQTGAIYTSGFSVCGNGSLALGSSAVFYKCRSGDFFNLYDRSWAAQCSPVQMAILPCGAADPPEDASQRPDGQVVGTTVRATTVVVPLSDGQPQVITTMVPVPLCQITDGQLQVHTTPCVSAKPTSAAAPVTQLSDGQIQVTSGAPVSQISDGQVQVTSARQTSSAAPTTARTTQAPSSSSNVTRTSAPIATATSNGVGAKEMGSVIALAVGVLGAVWVL